MKKTLAVLAAVGMVAAAAVTAPAPAQARGWGPGLAFGLAAGALAAGAAGAYGPYYYGPGYGYYGPRSITRPGLTPITAGHITIGTATGTIITTDR